jgi:hypothetical protein
MPRANDAESDAVVHRFDGRGQGRMKRITYSLTTLVAALVTVLVATTAVAEPAAATPRHKCAPVRPVPEFYEAGRVASFPLTVPDSACSTISVSHIKDSAVPSDHCQTFLVGFFPTDGSEPTYTDPVTACSVRPKARTVLATNVPDGTVYRILYEVDYIEPSVQIVRYKAWH